MSLSSRSMLSALAVAAFFLGSAPSDGTAQEARISEEIRILDTYPFSEPNPVPILTKDPRLYPYHSFEGYSVTSEPREWKVVKLENEWIEVFVLPEVGGKVWGAVVKETGHEFIYRNEVMKFRNIALRGPWTSGGIEFNFGVIGHAPSTATPVDYTLRENPDGSVSCWVGSMDLPSRTHWRVEVRLPADRAYFETNVFWYNPTPLEQPYYNWMTAAAFAQDDLEMAMPGYAYLRHSGEVEPWPVDGEGRYLPAYANNTFEGHKSYHVVGELNDFFGGYYHDEDYGFGHWARYEDMPGQKLWLWALSREGGVWEDLLTDTDGQYVEFQAGRLFVQYSPGSHLNPITQAGFDPMSSSRWSETWFPLEGTGGLTDASRDGALFASEEDGILTLAVNAFRAIQDTLKVWSDGELVATSAVTLEPLEPFHGYFDVAAGRPFRVQMPGLELDYESNPRNRILARPFERTLDHVPPLSDADQMVFEARELMKARYYQEAEVLFKGVLDLGPTNREAFLGLAELAYRRGDFDLSLGFALSILSLDAYDPEANFLAGLAYRAGDVLPSNAREHFGWAARSTAYRSASYTQLAELMIRQGNLDEAERYARLAIDFDRYSIPGWRALAVVGRKAGNGNLSSEALEELLALDPLHHFAFAERYLAAIEAAGPSPEGVPRATQAAAAFAASLGGEFPDQTLLELVIHYHNLGLNDEALELLNRFEKAVPRPPIHQAWMAWILDDHDLLAEPASPAFQFPFRHETLGALNVAADVSDDWVWDYLRFLAQWSGDPDSAAETFLENADHTPNFAPFFVSRALLLARTLDRDPEPDLRKAVELDPGTRIFHIHLIRHLQDAGRWDEALASLGDARHRFPDDFNLDLLEAQTLLNLNRPGEAVRILDSTHVLPSENARESHRLYEQAHTMVALDALEDGRFDEARDHLTAALEWPESLGQGKPYQPEERLVRFLMARLEEARSNAPGTRESFQRYIEGAGEIQESFRRLDLLTLSVLEALDREEEANELYRAHHSEIDALLEGLDSDLEGRLIYRALRLGTGEIETRRDTIPSPRPTL